MRQTKRLTEVLENKHDNYIFPLFWLHGEDEKLLNKYIKKIYDTGIRALCVESRPHPDFLGEKWWKDMDTILSQAKKYGMKVWLLDDSHFPTGYANGRVKKDFPQCLKKYLKIHQLDFVGPLEDASLLIKWGSPHNKFTLDREMNAFPDKILKILAGKRTGNNSIDYATLRDITDFQHGGFLNWSIPEGQWRIFVLIETTSGGESQTEGYLNPLEPEATQVLIKEIYESHYEHYKEDFGKTFAGFFSDEPRFGNIHGAEGSIGRKEMVFPWRDHMLEEFFAEDYLYLPFLEPIDAGGKEKEIRYKYMDIVSKEYAKCFTGVLAEWCHERHVGYIGHLIEDNNAHARLGYGAGHYFRALKPMDMAGIDVVLDQILPGMDQNVFKSMTKLGWDGEFFHFGLAKMGASLGHLDQKKEGRTLCEVFGAYGWAEGLSLMKFITDHMLVRGVNQFVPHAFNPHPFPDPDCPPHFYANGHDPEFRYMSILYNYMNRMCHLLNGGTHIAKVGVLYHAEAEWLGNYMLFQKPARVLMQNQIDFDVIPIDYLVDSTIGENEFLINDERFDTLVIPYAESLPEILIDKIQQLILNGVNVCFIDNFPEFNEKHEVLNTSHFSSSVKIPLEGLGDYIKENGTELSVKDSQPYLRYYHYLQPDGNCYMFFNEHPYKEINTTAELSADCRFIKYNALDNTLGALNQVHENGKTKFSIHLYPSESLLLVDEDRNDIKKGIEFRSGLEKVLHLKWEIAFATAEEYPEFRNSLNIDKLIDVNKLSGMEEFAGHVKYLSSFRMDLRQGRKYLLDLGTVNEAAELKVNGVLVGAKICYPYHFDVTRYLKAGINDLEVIVTDNIGKQEQDYMSQYIPMKPTGLIGPVRIIEYDRIEL